MNTIFIAQSAITTAGSLLIGFLLLIVPVTSNAQETNNTATLTLEQALDQAFERHPLLDKARAQVKVQNALLVGAGVFRYNPSLWFQANARVADSTTVDFQIGLEQQFEIAGQRGLREETASLFIEAANAGVNRTLRMVAADVHLAFIQAIAERELFEIAKAELKISGQLVELSKRRMEAGAGTRLEVAVAAAEFSKTEQQMNSAAGEYAIARAQLAYAIGLGPEVLPEPVAKMEHDETPLTLSMPELMKAAQENREDLKMFKKRATAARKRVELAEAEAWPDITLSAFGGQEASEEILVGGGISIPITIFQRNQGEIAQAEAALIDSDVNLALADQNLLRDVAIAFQLYEASQRSLASLRANVVGTEEALLLLKRAFETGKNRWIDILIMRRTLFDAQRSLVKVIAATHQARIKLDIATGVTPIPAGLLIKAENP